MSCQKVQLLLEEIKKEYQTVLGSNLVGIYVHGSIAFGCFNWKSSDIDYIVVVNRTLSFGEKLKLIEKTELINRRGPSKGIEMSVVLKEHCVKFVYPTPFELHFSNLHLEHYYKSPVVYCNEMCGVDVDLAAHFMVIKSKGIALYGDPIDTVFGLVDKSYYLDSIKSDIKDAEQEVKENPVYIILNLCRAAAYINEKLVLSKFEGGQWALHNLPMKYHDIISRAVNSYGSGLELEFDEETARSFCRDMVGDRMR